MHKILERCLFILLLVLSGCGGSGYTTGTNASSGTTDRGTDTVVANSAGAVLYDAHCAVCHLPLSAGVKQDRTAEQIQAAIDTVPAMGGITLSETEIAQIAEALSSTAPTENTSDTTETTPNTEPNTSNDSEPQIHQDIQTLMAQPEINCTNAGCHDTTPGSARINLLSGTLEDFAARLVNQPSGSDRCTGELLIDPINPENSLLLKLIDPNTDTQCMSKMPFGSNGVSPEALTTFQEWVDALIAAANQAESDNTGGSNNNNGDVSANLIERSSHSPLILGRKLKYLLHGGALTNAELDTLSGANNTLDTDGLDLLILDWMNSEAHQQKMSNFLAVALQQTPATERYANQLRRLSNNSTSQNIRANLRESFARTALRIINNDESFKQVITTNQWEVTTGVLTALAYADDERRRDLDFREIVFEPSDFTDWRTITLSQVPNSPYGNTSFASTDIIETMRNLQENQTLSLRAPRIGFFNTLAFKEQWQTNVDNQFRLNTNQTMIAALHMTYESGDPTQPHQLDGLDAEHAPTGSDCFGCHKNLDPMRNIFYLEYNPNNHRARQSPESFVPDFAFQNHRVPVSNMAEFSAALADHPRFAMAWTEKVCQWFTSIPCDRNSQEMIDLANTFTQSNYSFNTLVRGIARSTLITQTTFDAQESFEDKTAVPGSRVSIARGNHYCHALYQRLNEIRTRRALPPVPNDVSTNLCERANNSVRVAASIIPEDGVTRGEINFIQSSENDMMLAKAYDAFCDRSSNLVVGGGDNTTLRANNVDNSLDDMAEILLGIPSNASTYAETRTSLENLYDVSRATPACADSNALAAAANGNPTCGLGLSRANGLRLVWRTVCQSPDLTGLGL